MPSISPVAVVTGGTRGLGWTIGQQLIADGFHVVAADLQPGLIDGNSDDVCPEWQELDVTDHEAVGHAFDSVAASHGRIDLLVNNAGIQHHDSIEKLTWSQWKAVVDVNLHGAFSCLQAAGRYMLESGNGAIVNVASIGARGSAGRAPYASTKAALVALTATAGAEWASRGVRVNAVAPGYIDTGLLRAGVEAGTLDMEIILNRIPARRLAGPEEIAAVVAFLASPAASYIVGQTLAVDGGFWVDFGVPLQQR